MQERGASSEMPQPTREAPEGGLHWKLTGNDGHGPEPDNIDL